MTIARRGRCTVYLKKKRGNNISHMCIKVGRDAAYLLVELDGLVYDELIALFEANVLASSCLYESLPT